MNNMEDANFYSQMASSLADNSFDDSDDDEVQPSHDETKQLAQSVDVDDMDASLFSSLSSGPSKRRNSKQTSSSRAPPPRPAEVEALASHTEQSSRTVSEGGEGGAVPIKKNEAGVKRETPKKEPEKKKPMFDFEDEILDLLSDDEDMAPKTRTKPKIQLTAKKQDVTKPQEPVRADSKPITSSTENFPPSSTELERPGTSRGIPQRKNDSSAMDTVATATPTLVPISKGNADILKVETPSKKASESKNTVTFDDDDDDILGGLGFDDDKTSTRSKTATPTSRLNDLLGTSKPSKTQPRQSKAKTGFKTDKAESKASSNDTGEGNFQFSGYVPSSVGGTGRPPRRGSLKIPSGRQKGSSELDTSIMERPNTAPSPEKKSVHFAENLELSERPASSSGVTGPQRSSLKNDKTTHPSLSTPPVKSAPPGTGSDGRLLSKKPPLSVRTEESAGDGGAKEENVTLEDNLFALDPDTLKKPAGSRRRPLSNTVASLPDETPANGSEESRLEKPSKPAAQPTEKLEPPIFPWQKARASSSLTTPSNKRQSTLSIKSDTADTQQHSTQKVHSADASDLSVGRHTVTASFQEQLLQQQRSLQEQLASFQSQSSSALAAAKASSAAELERMRGEVESAVKRVKELEEVVQRRNTEISDKQRCIEGVEQKLSAAEGVRCQLEEKCKELGDRLNIADREMAQTKQELNSQIEELKMKLYKVELEKDQLQHTTQSMKTRHSEEIKAIQESHESRVNAMEESVQRRESRWKEEAATDSARFQEKMTLLEQEKTDALLALKKKLDSLEISKTNEIGRLKDLHYSATEDLKREHELDKQHLLGLHRQELEAVKAAHSHTRMLSDLSHKVEVSTRDMTHLQAKLEHAHSTELEERTQRVKSHEEHLKTLEAQLMRQKAENNAERDQLQSLIAKMESHVSQQRKQVEQEKWQLQQDMAKLTAQQSAFEEERTSSLTKLETERERLEQAKEKFLTEQQEILSQCYEERRAIAGERAALSVQQKRALEREQRDKKLSLQSEAERETLSAHLKEENEQLIAERAKVRREQEQLRLDREAVDRDRKKLEVYGAEIQQRSLEIEQITETAMLVREKGDQSLAESQRLQEELSQQAQAIQAHREALAEKEKVVALEQLSLAQEKRKIQHLKVMSLSSSVPEAPSEEEVVDKSATNPLFMSRDDVESQESMMSVSNTSLSSYRGAVSGGLVANRSYSPRASPLHVSALSGPQSMRSVLTKIDHSRNLRQLVLDAKKEDEYLERETNFVQSLQSSAYIY